MRRIVALAVVAALTGGTAQAQKVEREPIVRGKTVGAWILALRAEDASARLEAIYALRDAGPEARKGVPGLRGVFRDREPAFLHPLAAAALARVGPDAVPELVKGLADESDAVKGGSALALGLMGAQARAAADALAKSLADRSAVLRFAAAQALGRIGPAAKTAAPALRKALADDDASVRVEAASALWRVADDNKGVEALVRCLGEDDVAVVRAAVAALREMGADARDAADALKKVAQEDESILRRVEAAEAWYRVRADRRAVGVVSDALERPEARLRAVAALGTMAADHGAAAELTDLLSDDDPRVRREAACATCMRDELDLSTVRALRALLGDLDLSLRWWSALALLGSDAAIGKHEEELLRAMRIPFRPAGGMATHPWATIQETTAPAWRRATAALIRVLRKRPPRFRVEAALTLALLGTDAEAARPALIEELRGDKRLRRAAAEALGRVGGDTLEELLRLLDHKDARMREGAARAIGEMGVPARSAAERLRAAAKDREPAVRVQAALALWRVDRDADLASSVLHAALKGADDRDRWEAVEAVGVLAVEAAPREYPCEALLEASKDRDPAVKVQALAWLSRVRGKGPQTAESLGAAVTNRDVSVRLMAVEALGMIGPDAKDAVDPLLAMARQTDPTLKAAAYEALSRMYGKDRDEFEKAREHNELLGVLEAIDREQEKLERMLLTIQRMARIRPLSFDK
jgi:HEAT repeat protein